MRLEDAVRGDGAGVVGRKQMPVVLQEHQAAGVDAPVRGVAQDHVHLPGAHGPVDQPYLHREHPLEVEPVYPPEVAVTIAQRVCKFSGSLLPPSENRILWTTSRMRIRSRMMELPHPGFWQV